MWEVEESQENKQKRERGVKREKMIAEYTRFNKKYVAWQYFDWSIVNHPLITIIRKIKSNIVFSPFHTMKSNFSVNVGTTEQAMLNWSIGLWFWTQIFWIKPDF